MRLLLNKDGRQLGPYSMEEARALVLSGQAVATDWAWPDGATQWLPLKDVPGFSTATAPVSGTTPPPPASGTSTGEEELWRGRPSQIIYFKLYFCWAVVLLGVLAAAVVVSSSAGSVRTDLPDTTLLRFGLWPVLAVLGFIALVQVVVRTLRLRAIEYVVTTQRVRIVSGLFSKDIQEIELFRVKDTMVRQGFIPRLFGLGTITILSGDAHNPRLDLYGIPHAVALRERLRQEVMALRQRYGVREMDVM